MHRIDTFYTLLIGASLSEPHIGENCTRNPYIIIIIIIIFIMVRPSPARRSIYNVQRPHTSARGRQFLMLYSASKSCLRLSANFCALRLRVAAESAEQREVAANERTSRDRLAAESPQLDKLRERPGYSR